MGDSGNIIDADGIRMGTAAFLSEYAAPDFPFTDTGSAVLRRGLSAGSVPGPSFGISGSTSSPHSGWPDRVSFPANYHLGTRFLSW